MYSYRLDMKRISLLLFLATAAVFVTCLRAPNYPIQPVIAFYSISNNKVHSCSSQNDTIFMDISFTSGSGQIGSDTAGNLFLIDKRQQSAPPDTNRIPFVPIQGAGNGISGKIHLSLYARDLICLPGCNNPLNHDVDTLIYDIYIKDRAGRISNTIQSAPIYLQCK